MFSRRVYLSFKCHKQSIKLLKVSFVVVTSFFQKLDRYFSLSHLMNNAGKVFDTGIDFLSKMGSFSIVQSSFVKISLNCFCIFSQLIDCSLALILGRSIGTIPATTSRCYNFGCCFLNLTGFVISVLFMRVVWSWSAFNFHIKSKFAFIDKGIDSNYLKSSFYLSLLLFCITL